MKMIPKVQKVFQRILVATLVFIFALSLSMTQEVSATTAQRIAACTTFAAMRDFKWVAAGNLTLWNNSSYTSNVEYTGIPYSQASDTTLYGFKTSATMQYNSAINKYLFSQPSPAGSVGNDCSSAVAISWKATGSAINVSLVSTLSMVNAARSSTNSIAKLGTYSTADCTYTLAMTTRVSAISLYDGLTSGDACVHYMQPTTGHHAIFILSNDRTNDIITYGEQAGLDSSGSVNSTWATKTATYEQLKSAGYIPIRCTDIS